MSRLSRFAPVVLLLAPAPAKSFPIASFAQTQQSDTPFTYNATTGGFSANSTVVFNFLTGSDSPVLGPVAARFHLDGVTTGPVLQTPGGLLIERVDGATFRITGLGGPLDGVNLLSGQFAGTLAGQGTTAAAGGSESAGEFVLLTSAFRFALGGGHLRELSEASLFSRDAVLGLSGITPGPLTQAGGNLSGTPSGSNWSAAISGSFSAVPECCSLILTGLGLGSGYVLRRLFHRPSSAA